MPAQRRLRGTTAAPGPTQGVIGIISDTHGLMRPEALVALQGCLRIIHAGDLGKLEIFEQLSRIAPTVAVRGNVDRDSWADVFPETLTLMIGDAKVHVLHDVNALACDPVAENIQVVISGHSHRPVIKNEAGVLYLNPGSAGPRRFSLPITIARLQLGPSGATAELIDVTSNGPLSA